MLKKYQSKTFYAITKSLNYLDPKKDFLCLTLVSKSWNNQLLPKLRKMFLLNPTIKLEHFQRRLIWI
jgi:hypothetical protein